MKIALVTGASSGIGWATARSLAQNGYGLVVCGRRKVRLDELVAELSPLTHVHALQFDVGDKQAVFSAIEGLPAPFNKIELLVNNAGNAHGLNAIQDGSTDDWDAMLDSNVRGLLYVSRAVMPQMVERQAGQIINVGSIAGKEVYAGGNVYCATKHAVDALTKSMRIDLNPYGIRVSSVNPGLVETEFSQVRFKGNNERATKVYQGYQPLSAQDIADAIVYIVQCPAHVTVADLTILPTAQASATLVNKA